MINIVAIDHLVLRTTQLENMLAFYVNILGCSIERQTPEQTGLTQLRAGNALIDIVTVGSKLGAVGGGAPTMSDNNLDHFCLQIAPQSEDDIIKYLNQHGIDTPSFTRRYGAEGYGNSLYIKDPEGNTVELRCTLS
ncbi:lactoylglutathione lyase [Enterovibrio norvegicus]|uniref:VOC family protein n=1 Tax=Enterovibrio norvegicus TaxID=188144 RepID=UPI0002D91CDE|nr:VOC family protein [Enterovibrio norvegicus]OEE47067.1 lactoylglutathione lyase [Enterovibrio norvegicus]OEF62180.1 lactoylglutathione lyase [Enterovibrio norvegicus]